MGGLTFERDAAGVVDVVIDRPPHNLLTVEMCAELTDVLTTPPDDAHVLRLRATGDTFCLGRERAGTSARELVSETQTLVDLHKALRHSRLVSIAEVHGDAAGFGVGLVAACDVAVSVAQARFYFPEVGINLAPALVLAWLPRLVGEREAFWLTASGEPIDADRARELGLINEVTSTAEELAKAVADRTAVLGAHNPRVHAEIKTMMRAFSAVNEEQALDHCVHRLVVGALRRSDLPPTAQADSSQS